MAWGLTPMAQALRGRQKDGPNWKGHSYLAGYYGGAPPNPDFLEQPCEYQMIGLPLGCLWCFKRGSKVLKEGRVGLLSV